MKAMLHMLDAGLKKQSQPPVEYPMTAPVAVGGRRGGACEDNMHSFWHSGRRGIVGIGRKRWVDNGEPTICVCT